jgi:hypothetical protein
MLLKKTWPVGVFLCLALSLTACKRGTATLENKTTDNPLIAKEAKGIAVEQIAQSAKALMQSASLDPAVINKAMNGFTYKAASTYRAKRTEQKLALKEETRLAQLPDGSFHLTIQNDQQQAIDVLWVSEKLYWRGKGRPYRVIAEQPDAARRWQLRGYGQWRALVAIFGEAIRLHAKEDKQIAGRSCRVYGVALRSMTDPSLGNLPEGTAWQGKLPEHTRGGAADKPRVPNEAKGELCVDTALGFPLQIQFQGAYTVGKDEATVSVSLTAAFEPAPSNALQIPQKLVTIAQEPEPIDAFAKKKPFFFQPPPPRKEKP